MANINKIKLSGTTYSIQDENACKVVELTQAEYDDLPTTAKTSNSLFVITDAEAGDLSNYYTKSETDNAITAATSPKQDTLVSGTNIKTINNESILGEGNITIEGGSGGGKAIEAGRGISITTGETADTVSFNLPISGGTNALGPVENAIKIGENTSATSVCSFAMGAGTLAGGYRSFAGGIASRARAESTFAYGTYVYSLQICETAFGRYNVSNKANNTLGDSGNTLFSVGNGKDNAKHNAFEIRQNGDIYIADTNDTSTTNYYEKPMIKLQDALGGGGGSSYTAGDGIDITNDVISVTGKVDTSAITTSITSASTDSQVPSAKAVYDMVGNINTILESI